MAAAVQIGAPEGPYCCVPTLLTVVGFASSIVWYTHRRSPLLAFSATTAPWLVQHSYSGAAPMFSSPDEIGTNTLSSNSTGIAVTFDTLVTLTVAVHSTSVVTA